jgi:CheY-like chemotaxis protein
MTEKRSRTDTLKIERSVEGRRVVVIDDQPEIVALLRRLLEARGYCCEVYLDPAEALEAITAAPPAAIITDLQMPGMTGVELCERLEERLGREAPPRLVLSAVDSEEAIALAYSVGVSDYLLKPLRAAELYAKLERALQAAERPEGSPSGHAPHRLGPYALETVLGRGASGTVYLGRRDDGVRHAVKALAPDLVTDTESLLRFRREVELLCSLRHPSIIRLQYAGRAGETYFYAMDFHGRGSLGALIERQGALAPAAVVRLLADVGAGLAYLHGAGIVQRDVKPENLLFDERGRAILADFGLAKRPLDHLTNAGDLLGTPIFMAPELVEGAPYDLRTDLYALGMTALFALHGGSPFPESLDLCGFFRFLLGGQMRPVAELCPGAPAPLRAIIERLIARDPGRRFASASELLRSLPLLGAPSPGDVRGGDPLARDQGVPDARGTPRSIDWAALEEVEEEPLGAQSSVAGRAPLPGEAGAHGALLRLLGEGGGA